jgi:hypothetical protein
MRYYGRWAVISGFGNVMMLTITVRPLRHGRRNGYGPYQNQPGT